MHSEIKLIHADLNQLKDKTHEARELVVGTYNRFSTLYKDMKSEAAFSGQARDAQIAFMDLLYQYHGKFLGHDNDDFEPVEAACAAMDELLANMASFYDISDAYRSLKEIQ